MTRLPRSPPAAFLSSFLSFPLPFCDLCHPPATSITPPAASITLFPSARCRSVLSFFLPSLPPPAAPISPLLRLTPPHPSKPLKPPQADNPSALDLYLIHGNTSVIADYIAQKVPVNQVYVTWSIPVGVSLLVKDWVKYASPLLIQH